MVGKKIYIKQIYFPSQHVHSILLAEKNKWISRVQIQSFTWNLYIMLYWKSIPEHTTQTAKVRTKKKRENHFDVPFSDLFSFYITSRQGSKMIAQNIDTPLTVTSIHSMMLQDMCNHTRLQIPLAQMWTFLETRMPISKGQLWLQFHIDFALIWLTGAIAEHQLAEPSLLIYWLRMIHSDKLTDLSNWYKFREYVTQTTWYCIQNSPVKIHSLSNV